MVSCQSYMRPQRLQTMRPLTSIVAESITPEQHRGGGLQRADSVDPAEWACSRHLRRRRQHLHFEKMKPQTSDTMRLTPWSRSQRPASERCNPGWRRCISQIEPPPGPSRGNTSRERLCGSKRCARRVGRGSWTTIVVLRSLGISGTLESIEELAAVGVLANRSMMFSNESIGCSLHAQVERCILVHWEQAAAHQGQTTARHPRRRVLFFRGRPAPAGSRSGPMKMSLKDD